MKSYTLSSAPLCPFLYATERERDTRSGLLYILLFNGKGREGIRKEKRGKKTLCWRGREWGKKIHEWRTAFCYYSTLHHYYFFRSQHCFFCFPIGSRSWPTVLVRDRGFCWWRGSLEAWLEFLFSPSWPFQERLFSFLSFSFSHSLSLFHSLVHHFQWILSRKRKSSRDDDDENDDALSF